MVYALRTIVIKNHRSVEAIDLWDVIISVCEELTRTDGIAHREHGYEDEEELCEVF